MAQLQHFLGSILRDIAQARVASDVYSRDASRFYEEDPVLRRFPVPRVDLSEVEVDLKFMVTGIELDPNPQLLKIKIDRTLDLFSDRILHGEIETVYDFIKDRCEEKMHQVEWQNIDSNLGSTGFQEDRVVQLKKFFKVKRDVLITSDVNFDMKAAFKDIMYFFRVMMKDAGITSMLGSKSEMMKDLENEVKDVLKALLNEIRTTIRFLRKSSPEFKVDVDVSADRLQQKNQEAISSIKFKARMRNYIWSQVEQKDARVVRQLIPE